MASLGSSRTRCTECMRSFAFGYLKEARKALGGTEHVRGKKKSTRGPSTIPVRLLVDMRGYGPKGAVVPVTPGQMRNKWVNFGMAGYILEAERRALRQAKTVVERDYSFMRDQTNLNEDPDTWEPVAPPTPKRLEPRGISPERSLELVEIFVPKRLDFYRQVIESEPESEAQAAPKAPVVRGVAAELMAISAASARDAAKRAAVARGKTIYGSVSTTDVLNAVKSAMANNEEASRVVLEETSVSFTVADKLEDRTKLKHTGTFGYNIQVKGAEKAVSRSLRVVAHETAAPANTAADQTAEAQAVL